MCDYETAIEHIREQQLNEEAKKKLNKIFESKEFLRLIRTTFDLDEECTPFNTKDTFGANINRLLDEARESYIEEMVGGNESVKLMTTYEIVGYIKKFIEREI